MSTSTTEWKSLIVPAYLVEDYTEKCFLLHMPNVHSSCRRFIYISKKLVRFIGGGKCRVSYLPNMTWLARGCINREMTASGLEEMFSEYNKESV
jgi:hypothetical protein